MPDLQASSLLSLFGRVLMRAGALFSAARRRIVNIVSEEGTVRSARVALDVFEPTQVQALVDSEITSFVEGAERTENGSGLDLPPVINTDVSLEDPVLRDAASDQAVRSLIEKRVVTRDAFDALEVRARTRAFTVARLNSEDAIEKVRAALVDAARDGTGITEFKRRLSEDLETSRLGSGHVELIFRNNMQLSYHDGIVAATESPALRDAFPYREYIHVRDSRAREQHAALSRLGLSGTGVYRADDPFWVFFLPPWQHHCRCTMRPLSLAQAARRGVREAERWLSTGEPPDQPEFRLSSIPFPADETFRR